MFKQTNKRNKCKQQHQQQQTEKKRDKKIYKAVTGITVVEIFFDVLVKCYDCMAK